MIRQRDVDVRSLYLLDVTGEDGIRMPVEAAAQDFGHRAGVTDHARPCDSCDNIGRPTNRGVVSKDRGESLDAVHAVLERNHTGVGAYQRARLLAGRLGIPKLYGE